jgi:5-amino-6-(5-phosphoribosylamino)uracil reductase
MKPYVICHMCTTIDGRILGERWPGGIDSGKLFETTANTFGIKAWLVGTTTMREFSSRDFTLKSAGQQIERIDHVAEPKARSFAIGTDTKGVLRFKRGEVGGDHVVVLISELVSNDYLAHLRAAGVSYLFSGRDRLDLRKALRKIGSALGIRKLLLEGGGIFNGAMLKAGLIDEISQVIVPVVDGGTNVASLFDIPGPAPRKAAAALRLIKHRKLAGGIQWHRYRVDGRKK